MDSNGNSLSDIHVYYYKEKYFYSSGKEGLQQSIYHLAASWLHHEMLPNIWVSIVPCCGSFGHPVIGSSQVSLCNRKAMFWIPVIVSNLVTMTLNVWTHGVSDGEEYLQELYLVDYA